MDQRRLGDQKGAYLAITKCKDQSGTKQSFPDLPISFFPHTEDQLGGSLHKKGSKKHHGSKSMIRCMKIQSIVHF